MMSNGNDTNNINSKLLIVLLIKHNHKTNI